MLPFHLREDKSGLSRLERYELTRDWLERSNISNPWLHWIIGLWIDREKLAEESRWN